MRGRAKEGTARMEELEKRTRGEAARLYRPVPKMGYGGEVDRGAEKRLQAVQARLEIKRE